ncbi:MAG: hypothetical protein LH618_01670 [Saprospiraceae bacterium]|nr:hypothetical protein [Saprospiraceae bacterium]
MLVYNEASLKNDPGVNGGRPYQQCSLSVMDTIADPDIDFDEKGICNYYHDYQKTASIGLFKGEAGQQNYSICFFE